MGSKYIIYMFVLFLFISAQFTCIPLYLNRSSSTTDTGICIHVGGSSTYLHAILQYKCLPMVDSEVTHMSSLHTDIQTPIKAILGVCRGA